MKTVTLCDDNPTNPRQICPYLSYRGKRLGVNVSAYEKDWLKIVTESALELGFTHMKMLTEYELLGNYGHGWELEYTATDLRDLKLRLKEYRENGTGQYKTRVYQPVVKL